MNHTAFSIDYCTDHGLDLTTSPLNKDLKCWTNQTSYYATQTLADSAREAGIAAIRYQSMRDPQAGANIALLVPTLFTQSMPSRYQTWASSIKPAEVHCWRTTGDERLVFPRALFERDGQIVAPA